MSSFMLLLFGVGTQLLSAQTTLTVAAASDLTTLEPVLQQEFEKPTEVRIRWVTGASATLAQQIESGAPYDVFLSANAQFVDQLSAKGKIEPNSIEAYAVGRLGLLWRDGKQHELKDLAADWVRIVALPNPQLAPYGAAAQAALEHLRIWTAVHPKVVYGENVRQTLQLFESGNADAVLTSDSLLQGKAAQLIPGDLHPPIVQKAGIVAGTKYHKAAEQLLAFLRSPAAQAVFKKFGFSPSF
ncbi:MAG TPA: molybdate ABC transporter substrate-binding protein [Bryobacteraceae bacterium]|nr:molybdate ABC transporter substrate-binding protein [Bryobacteraceae bacterium]